jgi:hypothetical protein
MLAIVLYRTSGQPSSSASYAILLLCDLCKSHCRLHCSTLSEAHPHSVLDAICDSAIPLVPGRPSMGSKAHVIAKQEESDRRLGGRPAFTIAQVLLSLTVSGTFACSA